MTWPLPFPLPSVSPLVGEDLTAALRWLDVAAGWAKTAACVRSSCGSVVVSASGQLLGVGVNSLPGGAGAQVCRKDCGLGEGFKSDRTCCTHAEVRAIVRALQSGSDVAGSSLYFARLGVDGVRRPSGQPYCTICSKMALEVGIAHFVLEHEFGVVAYPTDVYNDLSFSYGLVVPAQGVDA